MKVERGRTTHEEKIILVAELHEDDDLVILISCSETEITRQRKAHATFINIRSSGSSAT